MKPSTSTEDGRRSGEVGVVASRSGGKAAHGGRVHSTDPQDWMVPEQQNGTISYIWKETPKFTQWETPRFTHLGSSSCIDVTSPVGCGVGWPEQTVDLAEPGGAPVDVGDVVVVQQVVEDRGREGTTVVLGKTREHLRRTDRALGESVRCPTPVRDLGRSRP